jgi:hypothetical protein
VSLFQVIIASQAICESEALVKFLKMILFVGNYMNSGSSDAGSFGFKLSFLPKLKDTKTTNGKQSLLHFIVNLVANDSEDLWGLPNELASAAAAASVDVANVTAEVSKLGTDVNKVSVGGGQGLQSSNSLSQPSCFFARTWNLIPPDVCCRWPSGYCSDTPAVLRPV